jgi:ectoine hydroxylase-related dioxygenase (phytanoyl-CoA dioxygenase family)
MPNANKDFFEENGYLVIPDLLSPAEVTRCQKEIDRLHHLAAQLTAQKDPAAGHFQREPYHDGNADTDLPILRKIENTRTHSEIFRDLAAHPKLVAIVQELIGQDLLLFRSTVMLKPAHHGSAHALHQDSAYWPMEPPTLVTVSIALSDATTENGCIKVVPQSHHLGLQEWGPIAQAQDSPLTQRNNIDASQHMDVPLKAGSVLFFHSLMVHGSGPNTSAHPRHTALYAYFSPNVRYVPKNGQPAAKAFPVIAGLDGRQELTLTAHQPA